MSAKARKTNLSFSKPQTYRFYPEYGFWLEVFEDVYLLAADGLFVGVDLAKQQRLAGDWQWLSQQTGGLAQLARRYPGHFQPNLSLSADRFGVTQNGQELIVGLQKSTFTVLSDTSAQESIWATTPSLPAKLIKYLDWYLPQYLKMQIDPIALVDINLLLKGSLTATFQRSIAQTLVERLKADWGAKELNLRALAEAGARRGWWLARPGILQELADFASTSQLGQADQRAIIAAQAMATPGDLNLAWPQPHAQTKPPTAPLSIADCVQMLRNNI